MSRYTKADDNDDFEVYERADAGNDDDASDTTRSVERKLAEKQTRRITPKGRTMMPSPALKADEDSEIYTGNPRADAPAETPRPELRPIVADEDDDSELYVRPAPAAQEEARTMRSTGPVIPPAATPARRQSVVDHAADRAIDRHTTKQQAEANERRSLADAWFDTPTNAEAAPAPAPAAPTPPAPRNARDIDPFQDEAKLEEAAEQFANMFAAPLAPQTTEPASPPVSNTEEGRPLMEDDLADSMPEAHEDDAAPDMHIEESIGLPPMPDAPLTMDAPNRPAEEAPARTTLPPSTPAPTPAHAPPAATSTYAAPATNHPVPGGPTMRLAIACTEFNYDITRSMLERAQAHAEFLGCQISHVVHVPGVYDLPLAVKRLIRRDDVDGVVTLGVVIEGSTDHDDLVIQHAARKIVDLSLDADKPVGLGVTGPGMSRLQAEARIDRAKDAVEACVKLGRTLSSI